MIPPISPTNADDKLRLAHTVRVVNGILDGRHNAVGTFTLAVSTTTTQVIDARVGVNTVPTWSATTDNAAATRLRLVSRMQGSFIVGHDSQTYTDRVFVYMIGGG